MINDLRTFFNRMSPFTGIWDFVMLALGLCLSIGISLLVDGSRFATTPFAEWIWRDSLNTTDSRSAFKSFGIWMSVFGSLALVIFLMAYPPRPWRMSPYRLRALVILLVIGLALGITLWFNGEAMSTLDAIHGFIPSDPKEGDLKVYFSMLSVVLIIWSILVLGIIWQSRQRGRLTYAIGRNLRVNLPLPTQIGKHIVISIVAIFVVLSAFHYLSGSEISNAPRMAFNDFKVAVKCPHKPKTVLRFINRTTMESFGLGFAIAFFSEEDWVSQVCQGALD